jgi:hypothetical protein
MSCSDKETVNHPDHYNKHPSGVECIDVAEWFGFNLGNAVKYIWRAEHKNDAIEDLKKAAWYVNREIEKRLKAESVPAVEPIVSSEGRVPARRGRASGRRSS